MSTSTSAQSLDRLTERLSAADQKMLRQGQAVVSGQNGNYVGQVLTTASMGAAWSVLTDYEHFERFLPNVSSSQVLRVEGDRKIVEQIDVRRVLLAKVESRVCTENIERGQDRIDFRLLEGDLKMLEGFWQIYPVTVPGEAPQVLIQQVVAADADAGLLEGAFHSIFTGSLKQNLSAVKRETERRS